MKKQTAVQLILSKWRGKMTQDQFAMWLSENQNILLAMERQQMKEMYNHAMFAILDGNGHGQEFDEYFTETYGE